MFKARKVYGMSEARSCPFCEKRAIVKNKQQVPVCVDHKERLVIERKCVCGNYLELKIGKFGPYFNCLNCGTKNFQKVLDGDFK